MWYSNLLRLMVLYIRKPRFYKQIKKLIMKKLLLSFCLLFAGIIQAQSPQLSVKGADSTEVRMHEMYVKVTVAGTIAYTTVEMHFSNSGSRDREGELLFPLPEGVAVSRYAIDINGKMREAVPVNKNKGKQVFEAIEHRRVDPGLLEKVEGNNFKTRIYPISPNKERIVIIGYEQELTGYDKKNLAYQLLSRYPKKLDEFELTINVIDVVSKPSIAGEAGDLSSFEKTGETHWSKSFQASIKKSNYQPSEKLLVKIPIREEIPGVLVQSVQGQHYFYGNVMIEGNKINKKAPNTIGLVWDNSLSCKNRDLKKELEFLDGYFKALKNVQVTLYTLNYTFDKGKTYTVVNGDWSDLRSQLEKMQYDGGTRFSKMALTGQDEYLFFTDGLSSLSENMLDKIKKPLYTITSLPSADYACLNYTSLKTGADFINLNTLDVANALDKIIFQRLKFLGIKENHTVTEMYPVQGTPVSGNFSFSGISLKMQNELVLLFGYGDNAVVEKKVTLDAQAAQSGEVNIERLWAQKKIANLEIEYKKNAEEIETLGKKFGIVTKNTSLIVLEDINDYILYDILPPAELRAEFDRIQKQNQQKRLAEKQNSWESVASYHAELKNWWNKNTKYVKPKVVAKSKKKREAEKDQKSDENATVLLDSPTGSNTIEETDAGREEMKTDEVGFVRPAVVPESAPKTEREGDRQTVRVRSMLSLPNRLSVTDTVSSSPSEWHSGRGGTKTNSWNPDRVYLKALEAAPTEKRYALYLQLREEQLNNPAFYFDVANHFYNHGDQQKRLLILSNIADLGLENHQLYKSLTYQLRQWEAYEEALYTANQVVKWRDHEPQNHRDLALALEDNKQYQAAFDELIKALEANYFSNMGGQYAGVEDIILMDINRMMTQYETIKTDKLDKKYLNKMPVAVRIILNWNQMDTDIDLHVVEPTGEECFYGHTNTEAGARFSKDFTQGYGPEQYLLRNAVKGKYIVKTNYYGESALTESGPATVMVEIYIIRSNGVTERKLQTIQLGTVKENQSLAEITIN